MDDLDHLNRQSDAVMQLKERQESALRSTDAIQGEIRNARLRMRIMSFGVLLWKWTHRLNAWREGVIFGAVLFTGLASFMLCDMLTGQRSGSLLCGILVAAWTGFSLWYLYFRTTQKQLEQSLAQLRGHVDLCRGSAMSAMANVVDLSEELDQAESELGATANAAAEREQRLARFYMQDWADMDREAFVSFVARVLKVQGFKPDRTFRGDDLVDLIVQKQGTRVAVRIVEAEEVVTPDDVSAAEDGQVTHVCHKSAVVSSGPVEPETGDLSYCVVVGSDTFRDFVLGRIDIVG